VESLEVSADSAVVPVVTEFEGIVVFVPTLPDPAVLDPAVAGLLSLASLVAPATIAPAPLVANVELPPDAPVELPVVDSLAAVVAPAALSELFTKLPPIPPETGELGLPALLGLPEDPPMLVEEPAPPKAGIVRVVGKADEVKEGEFTVLVEEITGVKRMGLAAVEETSPTEDCSTVGLSGLLIVVVITLEKPKFKALFAAVALDWAACTGSTWGVTGMISVGATPVISD
jgi:hypothetical protein